MAPLGVGERQGRCILRESSMAFQDRGPDLRCPSHGLPSGAWYNSNKNRPGQPRRCNGRLRPSHRWCPAMLTGFEKLWLPVTSAPLNGRAFGVAPDGPRVGLDRSSIAPCVLRLLSIL